MRLRPLPFLRLLLAVGGFAAQISTASALTLPVSENFDSMGTAGTTPPTGWSIKQGAAGTTNATWTTSITANGTNSVAAMVAAPTPLTASAAPAANNNNGYNAQGASSTDRTLATAPTSLAGSAIECTITNNTGSAVPILRVSYDIRRYLAVSSANELPGYQLFYSLDSGTTWTNVAALNPVISGTTGVVVPNTVGVTSVPATDITLSSALAAGSTILFRWVDDNAVATSPDQIIGLDNVSVIVPVIAPVVSMTAPADGASFNSPASITLTATASDADGTVTKVEFFNGATKLGEVDTAPFTYAWGNVPVGTYTLTAKATDNSGNPTTSTTVNVTVVNPPPTVSLTAPANNATYSAPATVNLTATAADSAPGTVTKVEFFNGSTKLGEADTAPYTFAWTNVPANIYTLTAVATDNEGSTTTSTPVTIGVQSLPPTVAITVPDPGLVVDAPASIYMSVNAADPDGTVATVEYYVNGTKIGQATSAPFAYTWNNVFTGSYTLQAKAIDNTGTSALSSTLHFTVTNTDNVAPTVAIASPSAGVVFAGDIALTANAADTDGTVSQVDYFNGATKIGTATTAPYNVTWAGVTVGSFTLTARATDNDGGVTTSASVPLTVRAAPLSLSQNFDSMGTAGTALPTGWTLWNGNSGTTNATWTDSIPIIANGTNSVAAMVAAASALTVNNAPTATSNNGYNAQGASSTDRVVATSPTSVSGDAIQWQVTNSGTTTVTALSIGYDTRRYTAVVTANELPGYQLFYSLDGTTWTNVAALNPTLSGTGVQVPNTVGVTTVSPTDFTLSSGWAPGAALLLRWVDDNAVATSPDQIIGLDNVTLLASGAVIGSAPTAAITTPAATDSFTAPATVNISASASDSDGTISKVEFYNGTTKLGEDSTMPFTYAWSSVATGTYSLTARATDNDGNVTVSSAVSITVNAAPGSGTLSRAAYLQQAGPTTMTIRWRSSQSITGRVKYGSSATSLTSTVDEAAAVTDHEVTLTNLSPSTTYFYSIGSAFDTLAGGDAAHTFTTPPIAGSMPNMRIWVLGDAGTGSSSQTSVRDAFYTWTGSRDPNLVLELGDNAYNSGLDSEFQSHVFDIYGTLMKRVPFWSCLGNHETNQATAFVDTYPYFSVYTFPKNAEAGGVASGTEHYYSFDYGNVHFIALDSMTASRSATGAMAAWLTNDLASTTRTWIICFFHHPPYTKGSHNSDTETELMEMRANILPILENGGVDLVLSGHSHAYERSYLLDGHYGLSTTLTAAMKKNSGDGRPTGSGAYVKPLTGPRDHFGAVYSVAGSAGQTSGGALNHPAHYISLNSLGSLVLDVSGTTLNGTFLRETGVANDTFTLIKQGAADSDGDGIPDAFEIANGLNRNSAADSTTDSDGDGISNLIEFAFGTNPSASDNGKLVVTNGVITKRGQPDVSITTTASGVDFRADFCRVIDQSTAGLTYTVQFSTDLTTWQSSTVVPTVVADDGTYQVVSVKYPFFINGQKARFFRVSVNAN